VENDGSLWEKVRCAEATAVNPFYTQGVGVALNIGMGAADGDGECRAYYFTLIDASEELDQMGIDMDDGC
jgi:hypothetical protein